MANEWRQSTWGDEISLEYGKGIRGYKDAHGPYRVYGSNGPVGWTSSSLAPGPGVILGRKGAYRGVEYSKDPFFVIDTAYYVKPKRELDMRWIYYAIKHHRLGEIDDGSPIPSTTRSAVYVRELQVPPLHIQHRIADILGKLDDKIELNRRMNRTLEKMAAAIFKSWFIDFDPVHAKAEGRNPNLPAEITDLFPDSFEESELGAIPKGWRVVTFQELVEAKQGKYIPKKAMKDVPDSNYGVPVWGGNGIRGYAEKCMYSEPIVVLTCRGSNCGLIKMTDAPAWVSNIGFGCIPQVGSTAFLYVYFKHASFQDCISGSAQPQITYSALKNTVLPYPVIETLVEAFSRYIEPMYKRIRCNLSQNRRLAGLRDTLLPKLLSGEIELPETEAIAQEVTG